MLEVAIDFGAATRSLFEIPLRLVGCAHAITLIAPLIRCVQPNLIGDPEMTAIIENGREPKLMAVESLAGAGVNSVMLGWMDTAGLCRSKAVPLGRLAHALRDGIGTSPALDVALVDDSMTSTPHIEGPVGDVRVFPDLSRLTVLAGQPGWAWAPGDRFEQNGDPYPACQRHFVRRIVDAAAALGLEIKVGIETEWIVTRDNGRGGVEYACQGPAYSMARVAELPDYLDELMRVLIDQKIDVLQLHPEYAPGQFEVSVAAADPLATADTTLLLRESIRAVSLRHGLQPMFGPVAEVGGVGNGRHLHLSVWRDRENLCAGGSGPFGMQPTAESFLAGILRELPALLAIGSPTPVSYLRLGPHLWAGAFHCWALENREAALRFIAGEPGQEAKANAEIRCFDPASSPYLLVGAVIAAGLAGIRDALRLPAPVVGYPGDENGQPLLPGSLLESVTAFESSEPLRAALGEVLFDAVLAVRRAELQLFADIAPADAVIRTRHRY
ncbi:glutamine synthetase [Nocardia sp. NPDC127579]|uniref:glutamine synthetase n=1 Tax=Nocardia sp. NPDC127579 TaxID=3345402 RepID=UPI00363745BC